MKKERLMELAGLQLNESVDPNKKYPVTVEVLTPKDVLPQLADVVLDMIDDGKLPEGSKLTMDMLTDDVMNTFVRGIIKMYDGPHSESAMADNYIDAMYKTVEAAFKNK